MKIEGSHVRTGMVIEFNGKLCIVTKHEIRNPGNLHAFNQVEMKDLRTGVKGNTRFGGSDKVEQIRLETKKFQYLYPEDDHLVLMDMNTYEQINLKKEIIGEGIKFLHDNMEVLVAVNEGEPITIELPNQVTLEILETEPVVKGQTSSSSYKPAIVEGNIRVMVPPFINAGDKIIVATEDSSYVGRASK